MKCYDCAKLGKDTEAVTICIVCGKGICMEHSLRENLPLVDIVDWGFGKEEHRYPIDIPKFLCADCKSAIDIRRKGK